MESNLDRSSHNSSFPSDSPSSMSSEDSSSSVEFERLGEHEGDSSIVFEHSKNSRDDSSIIFEQSGNDSSIVFRDSTKHSSVAGRQKNSSAESNSPTTPSCDNSSFDSKELERRRSREKSGSDNLRTYLYIQMELCQDKTLREWLENNLIRDRRKLLNTFNNIVYAVEYIHDHNLIHRDLKPSNVFFSTDGNVKVGDFGLVTNIVEDVGLSMTDESPLIAERTNKAGTELYMSPEQKEKRSYNHKVDIFSLGIILYEMLVPFSTEMERRQTLMKVRKCQFEEQFCVDFPEECELLKQALSNKSEERPTTRGLRSLKPLASLQNDLDKIEEEEKYTLKQSYNRKRLNSTRENALL